MLAVALLPFQMAIPWRVPHFVTQDGPSHLYASNVMTDVLLHPDNSNYSALYTVQRRPIPNWTANLLLALSSSIAGAGRAESLFASLCMLIGFVGWCYCARSITPLANAMLVVWFLWEGMFNFYLGMMLLPFVLGFYYRRSGQLRWRDAGAMAAGMAILWLTHPVPAVIAILALPPMAFTAARWREIGKIAVAVMPGVLMLGIYAAVTPGRPLPASGVLRAWHEFPTHAYETAGINGAQTTLTTLLTWYMCVSLALLRKKEWLSPVGGLAAAGIGCFALYLFLPNEGLAGGMIKMRFAWALFGIGSVVAWNAWRLRHFRTPIALVVAALAATQIQPTVLCSWRLYSAATDYRAAIRAIPPGASLVRMYYPVPTAPDYFGYRGIGADPYFHYDAEWAAQSHAIDLSDYEALTRLFPVVYRPSVDRGVQSTLWAMEGPHDFTASQIQWVDTNLPGHVGYVVLVGDEKSPEAVAQSMPRMLAYFETAMCRIGTSPTGWVRVYRNAPCR